MPEKTNLLVALISGMILVPSSSGSEAQFVTPSATILLHNGDVRAVAFSPDSAMVALGGAHKLVRVWDLVIRQEILRLKASDTILNLRFSPDGQSLVVACGGKEPSLTMWNVFTAKLLWKISTGNDCTDLAFFPDGKKLIWSKPGFLQALTTEKGESVWITPRDQTPMYAMTISQDGQFLVLVGKKGRADYFRAATGLSLGNGITHNDDLETVAFFGQGMIYAIGVPSKNEVLLLKMETSGHMGRIQRILKAPDTPVRLYLSPQKELCAVFSSEKSLRLADLGTGKDFWKIAWNDSRSLRGLPPDGKKLAWTEKNGATGVWDLTKNPKQNHKYIIPRPEDLEKLWADLGDEGLKAYQALGTLAASPEALPFVCEHLQSKPPNIEQQQVLKLIVQLDDDRFPVRARATSALKSLGKLAEPALLYGQNPEASLEACIRINRLLKYLNPSELLPPEQERLCRAVRVLELMGSTGARRVLRKLMQSSSGTWVVLEASEALERCEIIDKIIGE